MANEEHVKLLKQDVDAWDTWRKEYSDVRPNLSHADLSEADLVGANLSYADLTGANLTGASLEDADLVEADLIRANLSEANLPGASLSHANLVESTLKYANLTAANLSYANLSYANLTHAKLSIADLTGANLTGAKLRWVKFTEANLSYANLSEAYLAQANFIEVTLTSANLSTATFYSTVLANIDLRVVQALDTVIHEGPSYVDIKTVVLPEGATRLHFLRGVGFSDTVIDYYDSLFINALQYEPCFISYAHQDEALAQRLYKDLQDKGVRCWFAPHDLRPGSFFHRGIEEAIQLQKKLLLLLSRDAIQSDWVEIEVLAALDKERQQGCEMLFPVRLDNEVMHTSQAWAAQLRRSRHIGDFTNWQDETQYRKHFTTLLSHLKIKPV